MKKSKLTTVLAVIGALAAIAGVLYLLRDKLKALCPACRCKDITPDAEADPEADEAAKAEAEKEAAIAEEFTDYADVETPEA